MPFRGALKSDLADFRPRAQSAVIHEIYDKVLLVALRLRVDLGLKKTIILKKLKQSSLAVGYEVFDKWGLVRNIYRL